MARENTNQTLPLNAPDYLAWHVTQRAEKSFWNKVGAAWKGASPAISMSLAFSSKLRRSENGASRRLIGFEAILLKSWREIVIIAPLIV